MRTKPVSVMMVALLLAAAPAPAQERLSLDDAIARARTHHWQVRTAALAATEAATGVDEARAARLPRVDLVESWQRSDLPVFAFSSLLSQRRFSDRDFDVSRLNHPGAMDNFRSAIALEQTIFDGATGPRIRAARLDQQAADLRRLQAEQDVTAAVVDAYGRVLLLEALNAAARGAVDAATQDVRRARDRQEAGTATAADVLSLEVHLAGMRERDIQTGAEARIARARLNHAIGAPLDADFALDAPGPVTAGAPEPVSALEAEALRARPDVRLAAVDQQRAAAARAAARGVFLPQVRFQSGWEWNGGAFDAREPGWLVGAEVRLNLFRGFADRARLSAAAVAEERRDLERTQAETAARLDVRAAAARLEAAEARQTVAQAIVSHAQESQRITRDRYEQGLSDVTAVLQSAQAVLDAQAQEIGARVDLLIGRAALDRAVGR